MSPVPARTALGLAAAAVVATTLLLALVTAEAGLETRWKDQRHYLASAWNLAHGHGLVLPELDVDTSTVVERPLASFPPLLPAVLALVMAAGVSPEAAPTVVSLLAWPWLLAGIGLLARRLGATPAAAALATAVAALTWPYWNVHVEIQSEVLFLPLLVWVVLLLHDLPWRRQGFAPRFAAALALLALLLLTRYTGMFVFLPVVGWWLVARARQRRWGRLGGEMALFAVATVPFLLWLVRNAALTGGPFGPVLLSETLGVGPRRVLASVLTHATWLVLPAVRPGPLWRQWGLAAALPVLALAVWGAWAAWGGRRGPHPHRPAGEPRPAPTAPGTRTARARWLPASPLLPFLAFYVGFLVLAPLFMRMQGMIERYMAVVLCLAQPGLAALVSRRSGAGGTAFLAAFAATNLLLLAGVAA
ncbi:MAG TPA: hypothetical protein VHQ65_08675, partial [Thermoanaerobaculia bacterium]|nr:hypothetical protein [Thermoanaerobaculia bacterium]